MYLINILRAWAADALINLGYAIAPSHYLEGMLASQTEE